MDYKDIVDKEAKTLIILISLLQKTENKPIETDTLNRLRSKYHVLSEEKLSILLYAKTNGWIEAPEYVECEGKQIFLGVDSSQIQKMTKVTRKGLLEFVSYLTIVKKTFKEEDEKEELVSLQKESIKNSMIISEKALKTSNSAKMAAWLSAICTLITVILAIITLLQQS